MSVYRTVSEILSVKYRRDLETKCRGRSRSWKMAPFDRPYTTFYWSAIVNIALSCTVFELFHVEWYRDLEIWVRGHSRSFKMIPFERLGAVSYSPSIVTMALSWISSEIKWDIGRKSWFFHTPCIRRRRWGSRRNIATPFGAKKLEWWGYPKVKCLTVYTEYGRATDGRTDGQTDG